MAIDTSLAPYYDDFNEDKGFHRLLFRPSRAVQARELTQLQTILQNQITRFGQNIFKDGTVVIPGGISVDSNYEFVKVQDVDISSIQAGATVVGGTSGITAILIQAVAAAGSDPATLYIRYTDGGSGTGGRFQNSETLTFTNPNGGSSEHLLLPRHPQLAQEQKRILIKAFTLLMDSLLLLHRNHLF